MAFKVHHAVAKKAAKLNITLAPFDTEVVAQYAGFDVAFGKTATEALDKAITALTKAIGAPAGAINAWHLANPVKAKPARKSRDEDGEGEDEEIDDETSEGEEDGEGEAPEVDAEEDGEESDEGKSKVKKKYKKAYRPTKNKNGDELSFLITEHVAERDTDGSVVTPVRTDEDRLKKFATANGVWQAGYANLNVGMRRMNIGNRLRAKVKGGHEIIWAK